jgi:hypothetical protein
LVCGSKEEDFFRLLLRDCRNSKRIETDLSQTFRMSGLPAQQNCAGNPDIRNLGEDPLDQSNGLSAAYTW